QVAARLLLPSVAGRREILYVDVDRLPHAREDLVEPHSGVEVLWKGAPVRDQGFERCRHIGIPTRLAAGQGAREPAQIRDGGRNQRGKIHRCKLQNNRMPACAPPEKRRTPGLSVQTARLAEKFPEVAELFSRNGVWTPTMIPSG